MSMEEILPIFKIAKEHQDFQPDIYIVALQEIVVLNAKNCMIKDNKRIELWRKYLEDAL